MLKEFSKKIEHLFWLYKFNKRWKQVNLIGTTCKNYSNAEEKYDLWFDNTLINSNIINQTYKFIKKIGVKNFSNLIHSFKNV